MFWARFRPHALTTVSANTPFRYTTARYAHVVVLTSVHLPPASSLQILVTSLIPVGLSVAIVLVHCVRVTSIGRGSPKRDELRTKATEQHVKAFLLLTYLVLPSVSMKQLRGLNCVRFKESGHSYLRVDTSVWCDRESDEFSRLLATDVPLLIL